MRSRLWLSAEFVVLFVMLPLAQLWGLLPIPVIPILLAVTGYCAAVLARDRRFDRARMWRAARLSDHWSGMAALFLASCLVLTLVVIFAAPHLILGFVKQRPMVWVILVVLYPVLSALPQELVFRVFLFHRYRRLFSENLLVHLSCLLFGFMHIVYWNWPSVLLTVVGGYLFTRTWLATRSLLCVTVEHGLYGCFIFTIGLGRYFYIH